MNYPIAISRDASGLSDIPRNSLAWLGAQTTPVKLGVGAGVGALIGHFIGKRHLIGALLGAGGAYLVKTTNADGTPLR